MRKIFNKVIAGVTTVALVATLLVGISVTDTVKAEETPVTLDKWTFVQGGQFSDTELWNVAYITSVTMNGTNEVINGWVKGNDAIPADSDPSFNQEITASAESNGFKLVIENNSQDKDWGNDRINPWTIRAEMRSVAIEPGHTYTVSFKAYANKKKYCYVAFGSNIEGAAPYGEDLVAGSNQLIALSTSAADFSYTFTNWAEAETMSITLNLGAFNSQNDYAGNDVSSIITSVESMWGGDVYISDFTITDAGEHPDYVATPDWLNPTDAPSTPAPETTTVAPTTPAPTEAPTVAPTTPVKVKKLAKVKKVRARNNKKRTVKITWKKVKNAKKYQVKVGKKIYKTKKTKLTVKKLKKGKKYTIRVRAMKRKGYKAGAWSKKVKVRIKK